ncbi:MAG TPA: outer membrane beta-barrel protein [Bacteroidia bacterium]|nr:outer membrane beta-barrel protein [Bacteroidia bacterium]
MKGTKLEINGRYIGPRFNGVWMNGPRWGVYLAVKKSFMKEKLNVVFGVDDIFFTMIGSNRIKVQNQDWSIVATNDSRRFKISLSYTFGKVKVEERDIKSNEEEKGRLGK